MFAHEIIMMSCVFLCANFQSVRGLSSCLEGFGVPHLIPSTINLHVRNVSENNNMAVSWLVKRGGGGGGWRKKRKVG
jgi:hypothetical protein